MCSSTKTHESQVAAAFAGHRELSKRKHGRKNAALGIKITVRRKIPDELIQTGSPVLKPETNHDSFRDGLVTNLIRTIIVTYFADELFGIVIGSLQGLNHVLFGQATFENRSYAPLSG